MARWCMRIISTMTIDQQIAMLNRLDDLHGQHGRDLINPFKPSQLRVAHHGLCEFEEGKCKYCGFDEYEGD